MWTMCRGLDGYVYVVSCAFGRVRPEGMILQRVPEASLLDQAAYVPWGWTPANGWQWGQPATPILPGPLGELSLRLVQGTWVLSSLRTRRSQIVMRTAARIDGLWSEEKMQLSGYEVAQLYGGYVHDRSTLADLHFIVSQWITSTNTPYHAMQYRSSVSPATQDVEEEKRIDELALSYPFRVTAAENARLAKTLGERYVCSHYLTQCCRCS